MINFTMQGQTHLPLATPEKFLDPDFPLAVSFIYGDDDWVLRLEGDTPDIICNTNKFESSKSYVVPTSDHNLHMDNPKALAQCIINDVFGLDEPLLENPKFKEHKI